MSLIILAVRTVEFKSPSLIYSPTHLFHYYLENNVSSMPCKSALRLTHRTHPLQKNDYFVWQKKKKQCDNHTALNFKNL